MDNPTDYVPVDNAAASPDTRKAFTRAFSSQKNEKLPRIALSWDKVNLFVRVKDNAKSTYFRSAYAKKQILKNVAGNAVSGELLAIMGPTGCGKTSLMNILAGRVAGLKMSDTELTGNMYINGHPRDDVMFRKLSAYVLQDDRLYPHLTVHETLMMSAHFYMADEVTMKEKEEIVTSVINELGLMKTRDTIIGDEKVRGVSGGERKRANIAVQLISDPAVLFLDEPTSGLDSFQAQAVMDAMKSMAVNGRLVISVIHQPRSSIFSSFDKLLLLSEGRTVYMGSAANALEYFSQAKFTMHKFYNPADFFLDVLSPDTRTPELDALAQARIRLLADRWEEVNKDKEPFSSRASEALTNVPTNPMTFHRFIRNLGILFWRSFSELSRDHVVIKFKCILAIFFACIIGAMYNNIARDQAAVYNRQGLLFIVVINQGFNNVIATATTFPKEKIIVNRERATGAYDTFSYFFAKFFAEMPINLIPGFIFGTILYWIVDLNNTRYGEFIGILLLEIVTAIALGLAVSAVSPNADVATGIAIPCMIIPLLFGGFYINLESLPIVANWVPYASFIRWTFQAFIINEFEGETFSCSGGATFQCLKTGNDVISSLSFQDQSLGRSILGLGCCTMVFLLLAVFFLMNNRLTFLPMNHVGRNIRGLQCKDESDTSEKQSLPSIPVEEGR